MVPPKKRQGRERAIEERERAIGEIERAMGEIDRAIGERERREEKRREEKRHYDPLTSHSFPSGTTREIEREREREE
jgi:hypothetical protein